MATRSERRSGERTPSRGGLVDVSAIVDVVAMGGLVERHSPRLIAIDVEAPVAQDMADLLMDYQNRGELIYETGRS